MSDSYEMIVVASTDVAALAKLARAAGQTVVHWKGKRPEQLDKARVREAARSKQARADPWGELLVRWLKLSPNPGKDREFAALALDTYGDDAEVAAARRGTDQVREASAALKSVGDATSLALLEAKGHRKAKGDLGEAIARLRERTGKTR